MTNQEILLIRQSHEKVHIAQCDNTIVANMSNGLEQRQWQHQYSTVDLASEAFVTFIMECIMAGFQQVRFG
jgi:hypothetical protein